MYTTIVVPIGKVCPGTWVKSISIACPNSSVAEGFLHETDVKDLSDSTDVLISAGQWCILGGMVSPICHYHVRIKMYN